MARHGRRPSPAPVIRPVGSSPATNQATCFPPAFRRLQGEQLQARPTGFSRITKHESRNTKHESRPLCFCRCFPSRCGAAWGGLWRGMGGGRPPRRQHGRLGFHQPRIKQHVFPLPSAAPRRAAPSPACGVFTKHETRNAKHGFYAFLPTISHNFPRFPGISRPPPPPPDQGSARCPPFAAVPVALRPQPAFLTTWRGEVRERGRQEEARAAWRAQAYLNSTLSTASKRNEVLAVVSRASAVGW